MTMKRRLKRLAILLVGMWVFLALLLLLFQEWFIFPGRISQGRSYANVRAIEGREELIRLTTTRGDQTVAVLTFAADRAGRPLDNPRERPVVFFFYGNAMSLADAIDLSREIARQGIHVATLEYPGYGMAGGKPSEAGIYAAVDALHASLSARDDLDLSRLVPVGWSLGGAVAIDTAARFPVRGVAAMCSFTSIPDMGRKTFFFLPIDWLARHRFDNLSKLPRIHAPLFLGHGKIDAIVPFAMSERLAEAAGGEVQTHWIDAANHNDFFMLGGLKLMDDLAAFVHRVASHDRGQ